MTRCNANSSWSQRLDAPAHSCQASGIVTLVKHAGTSCFLPAASWWHGSPQPRSTPRCNPSPLSPTSGPTPSRAPPHSLSCTAPLAPPRLGRSCWQAPQIDPASRSQPRSNTCSQSRPPAPSRRQRCSTLYRFTEAQNDDSGTVPVQLLAALAPLALYLAGLPLGNERWQRQLLWCVLAIVSGRAALVVSGALHAQSAMCCVPLSLRYYADVLCTCLCCTA